MTTASTASEPTASTNNTPRFVLLHEEARVRGFRNALAFKRWCRRHAVPIRIDGRKLWVAPHDVDRAVATVPAQVSAPAHGHVDPAVADAVTALMQTPARQRPSRAPSGAST